VAKENPAPTAQTAELMHINEKSAKECAGANRTGQTAEEWVRFKGLKVVVLFEGATLPERAG